MTVDLPLAFCTRMKELLGAEYDTFLAAYDREPQKGLRVNTCKIGVEAFLSQTHLPLRKTTFSPDCFYLDEEKVGNTPHHLAGAYYVQEPAAMLPVAAAPLKEGDFVLDVCAAPGGKSTQIAAKIGAAGALYANEFQPSRAKILLSNLERLGIRNAVVTNTDAAHLQTWYPACFDAVFVDAPCSGEGMFRKNEEAVAQWSLENVRMCAERSYTILSEACGCLRAGGFLMYSTCTFAPEENEWLLARFLKEHPDFSVEPLPSAVRAITSPGLAVEGCREDLTQAARCYPHVTGGEGQFLCLLRKSGDSVRAEICDHLIPFPAKPVPSARPAARGSYGKQKGSDAHNKKGLPNEEIETFFSDLMEEGVSLPLRLWEDMLYIVPPHMGVAGSCFSCGVKVGEIRNNRLLPHHQLFMAYGDQMRRKWNFSADDVRILHYLHGETIVPDTENTMGEDSEGYGCLMVDGCTLGGVKYVGGVLKNFYPKGLRIPDIKKF